MGAKILIIDHNDSFTYNLVGLFEQVGSKGGLLDKVDVWSVDLLSTVDLSQIWLYDCLVLSPGPGLPCDYPEVTRLLDLVLGPDKVKPLPILGICLGLQTLVSYFGGTLYNLKEVQHGKQVELVLKDSLSNADSQEFILNKETDYIDNKDDVINMLSEQAALIAEPNIKTDLSSMGCDPFNQIDVFKGLTTPIKVGLYHSWAMMMGRGQMKDPLRRSFTKDLEIIAIAYLNHQKEGPEILANQEPVVMAIRHTSLSIIGLQFHPESYMTPVGASIIANWLRAIQGV